MRILVVVAAPGELARAASIENDLESLQRIVGGGIEMFVHEGLRRAIDPSLHLYVNEDGKALGLARNLSIVTDVILGPIIVSRCNDQGEEIGLDETLARRIARWIDLARTLFDPGTPMENRQP